MGILWGFRYISLALRGDKGEEKNESCMALYDMLVHCCITSELDLWVRICINGGSFWILFGIIKRMGTSEDDIERMEACS
jgi:hypothetical protein